jgi:hypothetical protein
MALTLAEASKLAINNGDVFLAGVMQAFAGSDQLVAAIPWMDINGSAIKFNKELTLPDTAFRAVGAGYVESTGTVDQKVEALYIAGGDVDVDKSIIDMQGPNARTTNEGSKIKALALNIAKVFLKGDHTSNPLEFDGIQNKVAAGQHVHAGATGGGDALSLILLDECIDRVVDPNALIMNKGMRRRFTQASKSTALGGNIVITKDDFGRQVTSYNGLPILAVGKDGANAEILPFTEADYGAGADACTSIYPVSFRDDGLTGIQNGTLNARDLGELETKPSFRTRIEWYVGLALLSDLAAARISGIKDVAITA